MNDLLGSPGNIFVLAAINPPKVFQFLRGFRIAKFVLVSKKK